MTENETEEISNACFETVFVQEPSNDCSTEKVMIEEADDIFSQAGGELLLRPCALMNNRHVFHVRGRTGKIMKITKSLMLWMVSSGRFKRSNDRLRRFHQMRIKGTNNINTNSIKQSLSTGNWIALQGNRVCQITNFKYQTGKNNNLLLNQINS